MGLKGPESEEPRVAVLYGCPALQLAPLSANPGVAGSYVAGSTFTRALIRYGRRPVDLVAESADVPALRSDLSELVAGSAGAHTERAQAVDLRTFQSRLAAGSYCVLHDVVQPRTGIGACLRAGFAPAAPPYTAMHYALSWPAHWIEHILLSVLPGSQPYDAIFTTSRAAEDLLAKLLDAMADGIPDCPAGSMGFRGRLVRVPYGVDVERFRPGDRRALRRQLGLPVDSVIAYWTGRFSAETKADLAPLLRAFALVHDRLKAEDVRLVLCGDDSEGYAQAVRTFARGLGLSSAVIVRTGVPSFAVPLLYAAANVFVAPSDFLGENFGLTITEAMASGLPVVASDWGGYKDTVVHGETGFLVRSYRAPCNSGPSTVALIANEREMHLREGQAVAMDVGRLAEYLSVLLTSRDLREEMGRKARQMAVEGYAWPKIIARHEEVWDELVEAAARTGDPQGSWCRPWGAFVDVFSEHPLGWVRGDTTLRLTERGVELLSRRAPIAPDPTAWPLLDAGLLERLLRAAAKHSSRQPAPVARLFAGVVGSAPIERSEGFRHLMWLLKYDLLEVVAA